MKVSLVGGATFEGAVSTTLDPTIFGDPPGLDHVHFDLTITQRFDHPDGNPFGFASIGVIIFGVTQPDFPGGQQVVQVQLSHLLEDEVPIGNLEPGTYRDVRIDLDKLTESLTFETKTFNQIFGTDGSNFIPTGFEFYFNKTGGDTFPLTVYIDNIRFGMSVPGDYNGNDVVDAADYVLWRKTTNPKPANFRNEVASLGTVDAADYIAWRVRFGNFMPPPGSGSGLGGGSVPEPASLWLMLMTRSALCCLRKRNVSVR
jgi:hypothetical protein